MIDHTANNWEISVTAVTESGGWTDTYTSEGTNNKPLLWVLGFIEGWGRAKGVDPRLVTATIKVNGETIYDSAAPGQ